MEVDHKAVLVRQPIRMDICSNFCRYLDHFSEHSQCSKENMIMLILDNHESYTLLAAIGIYKELEIVLLTIPPHTSHQLQPPDKSVFYSFKNTDNTELDSWNGSHSGKHIPIYNISQLVNGAQPAALVPRNILSGFEHPGECPFNLNIFMNADFALLTVTDRAHEPFKLLLRLDHIILSSASHKLFNQLKQLPVKHCPNEMIQKHIQITSSHQFHNRESELVEAANPATVTATNASVNTLNFATLALFDEKIKPLNSF